MNAKRYFQIIQMIRSDIFKDSKQLACLLLSMRDQYRAAGQMGLDMFQRLDCLTDLVEKIDLNSDSHKLDLGPAACQFEKRHTLTSITAIFLAISSR